MFKFKIYFLMLGLLSCHECMPLLPKRFAQLRQAHARIQTMLVQVREIYRRARDVKNEFARNAQVTHGRRRMVVALCVELKELQRQKFALMSWAFNVRGRREPFIRDQEEFLETEIIHIDDLTRPVAMRASSIIQHLIIRTGARSFLGNGR